MKLPYHDRYDYSPITERVDYSWPEGKRLAFHIAVNIEHFAFGDGLVHSPTGPVPHPDVRNYAWCDYGTRVGVWRIFDLLDNLHLPASHLVNSVLFDYAPQIIDKIRDRGDEFVGHGRTNAERQGDLAEADEKALIEEATEVILHHTGTPPQGWLSPWISESRLTPDLLKEAGYTYDMNWPCDDQPIWMQTRAGPLLSVPYPMEINDSAAHLTRRHTAVDFAQIAIDQFDQMVELCDQQPLVMGLALHTFVMGQPFRLHHLRNILTHIVKHPKANMVWFARSGEIASYVAGLPPGAVPGVGST